MDNHHGPVCVQVWRGALLLADYLLADPALVAGSRVLELAAGTGITSLTAAMFARSVTATDVDRGELDYYYLLVSRKFFFRRYIEFAEQKS